MKDMGICISTVHYAHICIIAEEGFDCYSDYDEINKLSEKVVSVFRVDTEGGIPNVDIDPEFRCNALTEVGLYGHDLLKVTSAAKAIAKEIEAHPNYKLVDALKGSR